MRKTELFYQEYQEENAYNQLNKMIVPQMIISIIILIVLMITVTLLLQPNLYIVLDLIFLTILIILPATITYLACIRYINHRAKKDQLLYTNIRTNLIAIKSYLKNSQKKLVVRLIKKYEFDSKESIRALIDYYESLNQRSLASKKVYIWIVSIIIAMIVNTILAISISFTSNYIFFLFCLISVFGIHSVIDLIIYVFSDNKKDARYRLCDELREIELDYLNKTKDHSLFDKIKELFHKE